MGFSSLKTYPWHEVNYVHIIELKRKLIDKGLKPSTINTYLAIFRSAVQEAWRLEIRGYDEGVLFNRLLIGDRITKQRLTPRAIVAVIDRRCEFVDIERITPHDLRRYVPFLTMSGKVMKQTAQSVFTDSVVLNTFVCPT